MNFNPVLILGLYFPGYSLLRDFSLLKIPTYGADIKRSLPGFKSKYGKKYVCPNPSIEYEKWFKWMIDFAKGKEKIVVFCTSDRFISPLKNAYEQIKENYIFTIPHTEIIDKFNSKKGIYKTCIKYNFPTAKTFFTNGKENPLEFLNEVEFPIISKPEFSKDWMRDEVKNFFKGRKVFTLNSKDEAINFYNYMKKMNISILFQEIIRGEDNQLFYGAFYLNNDGNTLASFLGRKIRIIPIHYGSASFVETYKNDALCKMISTFLKISGYRGICGVEIKKDSRDNHFKLIEINPRCSLWDELGKYIGEDVALTAYNDLTGNELSNECNRYEKIYWLSIQRDISAFTEYNKEKSLNFKEWYESIRVKPKIISDIRKDDIKFTIFNIFEILKEVIKFFYSKLRK